MAQTAEADSVTTKPISGLSAIDYGITGFGAVQLNSAWGLPIAPVDGRTNTTQFLEYRVRLDPSVSLGAASVHARVLLLDGVLAGNQNDDVSVLVGLDNAVSATNRFGSSVESIQLDRIYGEYDASWATFRVGRQGAHWGLGILANSADKLEWGLDGNGPVSSGDTIDRVLVETDLSRLAPDTFGTGHLFGGLAYDIPHEGDPTFGDDDIQQVVLSLLYSDRNRPTDLGRHEAGTYSFWINQASTNTNIGVVDGYGRFALDLAEGIGFAFEGEGIASFGTTTRKGVVDSLVFDSLGALAQESYASVLESQGIDAADAQVRAADLAKNGIRTASESEAFRAPLTAALIQQTNMAVDDAGAVADRMVRQGVRGLEAEDLTVQTFGGVVRAEVTTGPIRAGLETGGSRDLGSRSTTPPAVVGIGGGKLVAVTDATENSLAGDLITAGVLGSRYTNLPLDREYDPAVILFEEVGPLGLQGNPAVANAWYQRIFGSYQLREDLNLWGSAIYGRLATAVQPIRICCDCNVEQCISGDPTQLTIVREKPASDLGIEIDAGAVYRVTEWLTSEVKLGHLFTGDAFGRTASDVTLVRIQFALELP